jgi:hypothetical protein
VQRATELGSNAIQQIRGTSLDKGSELDVLIRLPLVERDALIKRAAAGERVSACDSLAEAFKASPTTDGNGRKQQAHKSATKDPVVTAALERAVARSEEIQRKQVGNAVNPQQSADKRKAEAHADETGADSSKSIKKAVNQRRSSAFFEIDALATVMKRWSRKDKARAVNALLARIGISHKDLIDAREKKITLELELEGGRS